MTTKSRFDYDKWMEYWLNWERSCANHIANKKLIWSIDSQRKVFQDLRLMLKEMKNAS